MSGLIDIHGNPLTAAYNGGGTGFGGQMEGWFPPSQSVDAALLPTLKIGNARADDLVRNNGIAANAVRTHQDHIVGHMFRLSYRPNWQFLGMNEADAQAFIDDIETAWAEYADSPYCKIDIEEKRTFTEFIREGVAVHAFNGEIFVQPVWEDGGGLFKTRFKAISPKRIENPYNSAPTSTQRAGVTINKNGKAIAYSVREGDPHFMGLTTYKRIPRTLVNGRPGMIHIFQPKEDGQTRGVNHFYCVMERMKMLDTLQATQLQSVLVKAMYAMTIESSMDTDEAMKYIAGADSGTANDPMMKMLANQAKYYAGTNIRLGGVKIPHLYPNDKLNIQSVQNSDNGYSPYEQGLLRYIAAGTGISYEQLSRDYSQVSYSSARASANEAWRYFMGARKFIAAKQAAMMFGCWLEEVIARNIIRPPSARFSFWEARQSWQRSEWIGAGRMAIDGLKEVQESMLLIDAGLSTYEKEMAKMGEDYQEVFRQQVRESKERKDADLTAPAWVASIGVSNDKT